MVLINRIHLIADSEEMYKKMFASEKKPRKRRGASLMEVVTYTLPKLHCTKKNWYVDFLALDPATRVLRRKKYMLDSIKNICDRKDRASEIITNVTIRLRQGWNPWADVTDRKGYAKVADILALYEKNIMKLHAAGSLKKKTLYDYTSRMNFLKDFIASRHIPIIYIYQFDQALISDFLDYIFMDCDSSARTRNNYRTWCYALCAWMVEKKYLEVNPVENIKTLQECEKQRDALAPKQLKELKKALGTSDKYFLLACMMEYYTLIRPTELSCIRLQDIFIKEQKVFVSSEVSKNRRDGMVGLNDTIIKLMIELKVFTNPSHFYLFGPSMKPDGKKADPRIFRDRFAKLRKAMGWPNSYMFYSLKDSGIRDLANSEGIVIARDQARHTDISTTNRYLKGSALAVHEETKHFKGNL